MHWFDLSSAVRGFVLMSALGVTEAYRQPVFDPGMVQAAPLAGLIMGLSAGFAAPPLRWLKEQLAERALSSPASGRTFCAAGPAATSRTLS
jgi:hypothetical protein